MLTIGFTNTFYTLWSVSEPYIVGDKFSGAYTKQDCHFIQNLSTDFETAKLKAATHGDYVIDLDVRGEYGYGSWEETPKQVEQPLDRFPYGKCVGDIINESTDVWQLTRLFESYHNVQVGTRRAVLARRRLVELGELIRKDWSENVNVWDDAIEDYIPSVRKHKYATKWQMKRILTEEKSGHWFNNGDKVTIEVKTTNSFSFSTQYGLTYIVMLEDKDGKIFKYKGNNPPSDFEDFTSIKATIKHSAYNGVDETCLLRIKEL